MKRPFLPRGKRPFPKGKRDGAPQRIREETPFFVGVAMKTSDGWGVQATNRREKGESVLHVKTRDSLEDGQIIVAEKLRGKSRFAREAKLVRIVGHKDSPDAVSLIAIATHDIPCGFSSAALKEAEAAQPVTLVGRTDLRDIPLVTIDGADARDFDDAVFAEADGAGWHLIVAIADVAHYVKSGSALDQTARERGNSVYFPDHVVPMLPEALSNELCSLKPHVDRACLAAHLWIDKAGELVRWRFVRGLMRSHARLTYEQAQAALDGKPDSLTAPLIEKILRPLHGAFTCLLHARGKRGTLELDLPERKVIVKNGAVVAIDTRERLDTHRLIEEFMIAANVAAAAQLEGAAAKGVACLYRVHDKPSELKLEGLRDFLDSLGISLVPKKQLHPRFLTQILENAAGTPHAEVVNEIMLRSQAQAIYSPENIGHFGLALAKYAHFTSPIRRYADLIVHRGLIRACGLGADGLTELEVEKLDVIADQVSKAERRATAAEREAIDRFITLFMADKVGATFPARISGVAHFGLFARLDTTGADGIIPMATLPNDYYIHDEKRHALTGRRSGRTYQLGQRVIVRLAQADRLTGGLSLVLVEEEKTLSRGEAEEVKKKHRPRKPKKA